jgi:hypothetical protein
LSRRYRLPKDKIAMTKPTSFDILDPAATITVSDNVMTIEFRYPDGDTARQLLADMLTAYEEGESITFELSKPLQPPITRPKRYGHPDELQ